MGEGQSLQQMVVGKLDVHMQRLKLEPYFIPYIKINSKSCLKPVELLEEKIAENFLILVLAMNFWI